MNDDNIDKAEAVLNKRDLATDPLDQFRSWYERALSSVSVDPNAMTLATATKDGVPSARIVLLKGYDQRGFVFFTNYESRKGRELEENPRGALVFYWRGLNRQIRITGTVEKTTQKESEEYFRTRSRDSRLGAWASNQSSVIESREALDQAFEKFEDLYPDDDVPLPPFWGGFRLKPDVFEFWEGRTGRLHDRFRYTRQPTGHWIMERLSP